MWRALIFFLAAVAWAQSDVIPKPVFPDDTQDPKVAGGAELLEAVCPGHVLIGKEIQCSGPCSAYTSARDWVGTWTLTRLVRGRFLSPDSEDIVLAMSDCEPHSENFGGTILLTRRDGKWIKLWYKAGVPTVSCRRVRLDSRREVLVCLGGFGGQGFAVSELYVEDLRAPRGALMSEVDRPIFQADDTVGTCGYNNEDPSKPLPLERNYIERVVFDSASDGTLRKLSVYGRSGRRTMTPQQVEQCEKDMSPGGEHSGINFIPPTKPFRVDFTFDGTSFRRVGKE